MKYCPVGFATPPVLQDVPALLVGLLRHCVERVAAIYEARRAVSPPPPHPPPPSPPLLSPP
eukprot:SAG11_NODE_30753_length_298_cov_0.618090_1_plen_60_part_10